MQSDKSLNINNRLDLQLSKSGFDVVFKTPSYLIDTFAPFLLSELIKKLQKGQFSEEVWETKIKMNKGGTRRWETEDEKTNIVHFCNQMYFKAFCPAYLERQ